MADLQKQGPTEYQAAAPPTWLDEVYSVLKSTDVRQVAMVPDAGHRLPAGRPRHP